MANNTHLIHIRVTEDHHRAIGKKQSQIKAAGIPITFSATVRAILDEWIAIQQSSEEEASDE